MKPGLNMTLRPMYPVVGRLKGCWAEFRAGESLEAQLAHDADQLDMIGELKEKQDLGNQYAKAWLFYAEKRLKTRGRKASL